MKEQTLKKIYVFIQVSFSLIFLSLIILSKGTTDAGDGITHYLISKGALNHPELFFDHWGKPLFTMFSSGFSYFGYKGICVFNGLCIIATSIIAELVVKKHTKKSGFPFAFILTLFCPVLFACGFAGLTEPLFALILCLGIFLLYTERYISGSLLLSFIPFVRTEGFLLIPIFFLFTILQKKWKSGLWLTAGTIMMSLGGSWVYNTIFWILEKNPYKGAKALYGSGPLMHFVVNSETIFGWAFTIILFSGISIILFRTLKNKAPENQKLILLCILTFFTYYIAHSIFWWKGLVGSLGLFRVMAAIVPAGSIIGAIGIHQILAEKDKKIYLSGPIILLLVWHIYHPFKLYKPPIKPDGEQALFLRISRDLEKEGLQKRRFVFSYPFLSIALDKDRFNQKECLEISGLDKEKPEATMKQGDILIWDSHFGKESGRPLQRFLDSPEMQLLKYYKIKEGESVFEAYVMEKRN